MTFRMSRVMACVAFAVLIGCEADMPLSEARDTYRLNVGGESVDQFDGKTFSPAEVEGALRRGRIDQIFGSNDPAIYQSYVEGPISVGRSVPEGSYSLTLHFAEPDDDVKAGDRVFAVAVEETQHLDALDVVLFRDGRARSALTVTLPNIEVTDGALDVRLVPVKGQPILGALEIEPTRLLGEPDPSSLVWEDNFEGTELDLSSWNIERWEPRRVNDEDQAYTDNKENLRVEGGKLIIEAHRQVIEGASTYTSARITTQGKVDIQYGRIDVRARLPGGQGTWPAIWMLPSDPFKYASNCAEGERWQGVANCDAWPNSGEIDIMEHVGYQMNHVHATVHTKAGYWVNWEQRKGRIVAAPVDQSFNDYSLVWGPDRIDAYMNGTHYFRYQKPTNADWTAWPFDHPFHLILNVAVGGAWGRAGGPIDDSIFPVRMEIEHARVYRHEDASSTGVLQKVAGG